MPATEPKRDFVANDVFAVETAILGTLEQIMSALTDLQTAVSGAVAKIADLEAKLASASAPVVVQGTADADLAAQTAALNAAVAPAAPAAPSAS